MNKNQNWTDIEAVVTHEDGYRAYATVWFNVDETVAIEPHSFSPLKNGEIHYHYYNRIMGKELMEYGIELLD